jgi:hypothetical protein
LPREARAPKRHHSKGRCKYGFDGGIQRQCCFRRRDAHRRVRFGRPIQRDLALNLPSVNHDGLPKIYAQSIRRAVSLELPFCRFPVALRRGLLPAWRRLSSLLAAPVPAECGRLLPLHHKKQRSDRSPWTPTLTTGPRDRQRLLCRLRPPRPSRSAIEVMAG